jgi:hypothetical protein
VSIRTYRPGDEEAQVHIYNAAAGALPKFKPAVVSDVQRRIRGRDFDPASRFYAEEAGKVVGYAGFHANGRVSYPWCLPGHEHHAEPLFAAVVEAMRRQGQRRAFAAYREDWPRINEFFVANGFRRARDMVSFVIDFFNMPTPSARPNNAVSPLTPADVPALLTLYPEVLRVKTVEALTDHLFNNRLFAPASLFALRSRQDNTPAAVGILITDPAYAAPRAVDAAMPCFHLGAFGTEGMSAKRIRGLFSFIARPDKSLPSYGMDLMGYAAQQMVQDSDDIDGFAAQVPSDAAALLAFYQRHFERQGSFPVYEFKLS